MAAVWRDYGGRREEARVQRTSSFTTSRGERSSRFTTSTGLERRPLDAFPSRGLSTPSPSLFRLGRDLQVGEEEKEWEHAFAIRGVASATESIHTCAGYLRFRNLSLDIRGIASANLGASWLGEPISDLLASSRYHCRHMRHYQNLLHHATGEVMGFDLVHEPE
jgi:hypothetical protein